MQNTLKTFIIRITIMTIVIGAIGGILFSTYLKAYYLNVFPYMLMGVLLLTIGVHTVLIKSAYLESINNFNKKFLLSLLVKLFVYFIFAIVYMILNKENIISFIIVLLFLYFYYSIFEIVSLVKTINKIDRKDKGL
jgi:hypothetical protein